MFIGHRNNILGNYTHFGSAAVKAASGKVYWTQQFALSKVTEPCFQSKLDQPSISSHFGVKAFAPEKQAMESVPEECRLIEAVKIQL